MTLNEEVTDSLKSQGASLIGFGDLHEIDPKARDGFPFGISIAVALDPDIIAGIKDGPNRRYYDEYRRANSQLDNLGSYAARLLQEKGHRARFIAATNAGIDWDTLSTILPHKTVAARSGLGWIGKCALLITQEYGPAVRFTTVLTDASFQAGEPVKTSRCGECTDCVDICPGHAIVGLNWQPGMPRQSLYDAFACRRTAQEFEMTREGVHNNICGMCIAACPWTKKYLKQPGRI